MTLLWCDAQAASWLSLGRARKYCNDSVAGSFVAVPVTTTCRSSGNHGKSRETCEFSAMWRALRLSRLVKKTKPRASRPFSKTARRSGCPAVPTVARLIALGSVSCVRTASSSHASNCAMGSARKSSRRNRSDCRKRWPTSSIDPQRRLCPRPESDHVGCAGVPIPQRETGGNYSGVF